MVLGAGLLILAAVFFLRSIVDTGSWGPSGARFGLIVAAFPGVPGACALLFGIYLVRQAGERREKDGSERSHGLRQPHE
jgi:hypothetical protein